MIIGELILWIVFFNLLIIYIISIPLSIYFQNKSQLFLSSIFLSFFILFSIFVIVFVIRIIDWTPLINWWKNWWNLEV